MQEYEETARSFKINGYYYNFKRENKNKNKYYKCDKQVGSIKCGGSITISPNRQIIKRVEHTCNPSKIRNNQPKIISLDGYSYNYNFEYKNKNKHFLCKKSKADKCRGSVTLSPNGTIVRKRSHACSDKCKVKDNRDDT